LGTDVGMFKLNVTQLSNLCLNRFLLAFFIIIWDVLHLIWNNYGGGGCDSQFSDNGL